MKKLLSLLGTLGLVSTSATAVISLTTIPKSKEGEEAPEVTALKKLIIEAEELVKNEGQDKTNEANKKLFNAIGEAKGTLEIYENTKENGDALSNATTTLEQAMNKFKDSNSNAYAEITRLNTRIEQAENIIKGYEEQGQGEQKPPAPETSFKTRNLDETQPETKPAKADPIEALKKALEEAKDVLGGKDKLPMSKQNDVNLAANNLQNAMLIYKGNEKSVDKSKLTAAYQEGNSYWGSDAGHKHNNIARGTFEIVLKGAFQILISSELSGVEGQKVVDGWTQKVEEAFVIFKDSNKEKAKNLPNLKTLLEEAKTIAKLDKHRYKNKESRKEFEEKIATAQGIVNGEPSIDREKFVEAKIKELEAAIKTFEAAENEPANIETFKTTIEQATKLQNGNKDKKRPGDIKTFEAALKRATEFLGTSPTIDKQGEVENEHEILWDAMLHFAGQKNRSYIQLYIPAYTSLGLLPNNDKDTVKNAIIEKFKDTPVKEGDDYTIGDPTIDDVDKGDVAKWYVKIEGIGNYRSNSILIFTLPIGHIQKEIEDMIHSSKEIWKIGPLQKAIEDKKIDRKNAIEVDTEFEYADIGVKRFSIKANEKSNYSRYKGGFIVDQILNRETQSLTMYLDIWGNLKWIDGVAPEGTKEIVNLGWDKTGKAYKMPSTVQKVPKYVSPNITNMDSMFEGAKDFNQDLSGWDVSKVTSYKDFDKDATAWTLPKPNFVHNI
ncbi:hypothetical protein ELUMI_v1c00730 [Williamsoniiplasma luminosum]|uniref:Uncharacterized protein n=1 Tax=Williamsoniiplasma luminosum TaxID=214888 RepID=A0A2K8NVM8_9MOLU|nr:BspA family leucine-rich repeat surface protein [Williamsoniiplasma luminosum]ATZ16801.1 hypothetical protein ELUMI_v1c00730 [Williamsoniiplasma luminosum]